MALLGIASVAVATTAEARTKPADYHAALRRYTDHTDWRYQVFSDPTAVQYRIAPGITWNDASITGPLMLMRRVYTERQHVVFAFLLPDTRHVGVIAFWERPCADGDSLPLSGREDPPYQLRCAIIGGRSGWGASILMNDAATSTVSVGTGAVVHLDLAGFVVDEDLGLWDWEEAREFRALALAAKKRKSRNDLSSLVLRESFKTDGSDEYPSVLVGWTPPVWRHVDSSSDVLSAGLN